MERTKKDFIRNTIVLSIITILNVFLVVSTLVPALHEIKDGLNFVLAIVYFVVVLLFVAIINVDIFARKEKSKTRIVIPIMSGIVIITGIVMLILL